MPEDRNILAVFRANKPLFIIIIIGLFLVELEIFAVAALKSGKKSTIQVFDSKGSLIHEADGKNLSQFNKYYFEKTFGPLTNYDMKLKTRVEPFPFRAWFAAAVGIPVGMILLFGFILKAYVALFFPDRAKALGDDPLSAKKKHYESKLEGAIDKVSRMNVFIIGLIVFLTVVGLWFLPNTFQYIGKSTLSTIEEHKWIFMGAMGVLLAVVLWLIYLRYLLAKKTIESQMELNKYQLQLQYDPQKALMGGAKDASDPPLIELDQHRLTKTDVNVKNHL